jgi:hypothetical protein
MRLVALEDERVARTSGAPLDSIRCKLGANRAAISRGYTNVTGNCWVAAEDGCPAGRMVGFARVNEGEGSYLRLVITTCVAFGVETCSAH